MAEFLTLPELAKREGFEGAIAEQLNKESPLLSLMTFEVRPGGIKKYGVRESLPQFGFRGVNEAITPDMSVINPHTESCAVIENNPWIDKAAVDGDPASAMGLEISASVERMIQVFGNSFYYGDRSLVPEELDGLYTRILTAGDQWVSASGTGVDLSSVFVVNFAPNQVQGIIPKEEAAFSAQMLEGLHEHPTKRIMGYKSHIYGKIGMAVCNPFSVCQYGNIETNNSGTNEFDLDEFDEALSKVKGAKVALMARTVWLRFQKLARASVTLQTDDLGRQFSDYGGVPVYIDENIVLTETAK